MSQCARKLTLVSLLGGLLMVGKPALAGGRFSFASRGGSLPSLGVNPFYLGGYGNPYFGSYFPDFYPNYYAPYGSYGGQNLSNHWWAGPNASTDPRQAGYNPSGGYPWNSVATLILSATPGRAQVILDGVPVGAANFLGPIQLPKGEHTLRVESPGFKPSETVIKVEEPTVQQLDVRLSPIARSSKLASHAKAGASPSA